jgi:hypothetical protein
VPKTNRPTAWLGVRACSLVPCLCLFNKFLNVESVFRVSCCCCFDLIVVAAFRAICCCEGLKRCKVAHLRKKLWNRTPTVGAETEPNYKIEQAHLQEGRSCMCIVMSMMCIVYVMSMNANFLDYTYQRYHSNYCSLCTHSTVLETHPVMHSTYSLYIHVPH